MKKRSRYLLLFAGCLFFLTAAPIMVLYVQGISIDFTSGSLIQTGILNVKTDPSDAQIYLNGGLVRRTNGTVRFLVPAEYTVEIKKAGYLPWTKRLKIESSQVTFANPAYNSIYLFLENPEIVTIDKEVKDALQTENGIAILNSDFILLPNGKLDAKSARHYRPPFEVNEIFTADRDGKNFLLVNNCRCGKQGEILVFNADDGAFYDVTKLVTGPSYSQFSNDGNLYILENDTVFKIDPKHKTKAAVFSPVKTFYTLDGNLYYVQAVEENSYSLFVSTSPFNESQLLLNNLPAFSQGKLFVNFEKQIFLLADDQLYRSSGEMELLQRSIGSYSFDPLNSTLGISAFGEFDYISGMDNQLNFVTRSSQELKNLIIGHSISCGFYLKDNEISAIELDTRDRQNIYSLYKGSEVKKFGINDNASSMWLLDGGALKILTIR